MAFDFQIIFGSAAPIFKQIVDQVRVAVATGQLVEGEQLPSVRGLAERLLVNPNTIAKAYAELTRDGFIDGQKGRGVFVARRRQMYTKTERMRRIEPLVEALIHEGLATGFSGEELLRLLHEKCEKLGLPVGEERKTV